MPSKQSYAAELRTATQLARKAGALARKAYGSTLDVRFKHGNPRDLVTGADEAGNALITAALRKRYPDYNLLTEEEGLVDHGSAYTWLADPIDGTMNFVRGIPFFSTAIALLNHGEPVVGVVYEPLRDELYAATKGGGAFVNKKPLHVSSVSEIKRSLISQNLSYAPERREKWIIDTAKFLRAAASIRCLQSSNLELCNVARGSAEGFLEYYANPWDVLPAALLITEAGGRVEVLEKNLSPFERRSFIASNGKIHDAFKRLVNL